jgi:hypothetical protein
MQEVNAVAKRPSETEQAMITVLGEALVALVPVPGDCADAVLRAVPGGSGLLLLNQTCKRRVRCEDNA